MYKFRPIEMIPQKRGASYYIKIFINKISSALEVLLILSLWLVIFNNKTILGGFTREEMITYILAGSLMGLIARHLLHRIIAHDTKSHSSLFPYQKPIKYFQHILLNDLGKLFLPFTISVIFHLILLYFFIDSFIINFNIIYLFIIILMIILAFITEFLMAYLFKLFISWTIDSEDLYKNIVRLKKIIAGHYFPLSLLPSVFVDISLMLPFAYSFFVPTQLYLKKISLGIGLRGIGIQALWIIALYIISKIIWKKKIEKQKAGTE